LRVFDGYIVKQVQDRLRVGTWPRFCGVRADRNETYDSYGEQS